MAQKCKGCEYEFELFGYCLRALKERTSNVAAEVAYKAEKCPYKDMRKEDGKNG